MRPDRAHLTLLAAVTSVALLLLSGLGFAWLPIHLIEPLLQQGRLHHIRLKESSSRKFFTHLVVPNPERLGPSASRLLECLRASHRLRNWQDEKSEDELKTSGFADAAHQE